MPQGHLALFVSSEREKHRDRSEPAPRGRIPDNASVVDRALRKFKTEVGQQIYSERKRTIEAVLGQIKEARGIRTVLLRGLEKVSGATSS